MILLYLSGTPDEFPCRRFIYAYVLNKILTTTCGKYLISNDQMVFDTAFIMKTTTIIIIMLFVGFR